MAHILIAFVSLLLGILLTSNLVSSYVIDISTFLKINKSKKSSFIEICKDNPFLLRLLLRSIMFIFIFSIIIFVIIELIMFPK